MISSNNLIKSIAELRKENEELQNLLDILKIENFEYALKCNRMGNILADIKKLSQSNPGKMLEATQQLQELLQTCTVPSYTNYNADVMQTVMHESSTRGSPSKNSPRTNKAHVVKPHMVNGTILYIPTINLTRVSDTQSQTILDNSLNNPEGDCLTENNTPTFAMSDQDTVAGNSMQTTELTNNEITRSHDISEPSTSESPSHSTVLSGTFQEVKIYLSPMTQDQISNYERSISLRSRSK